MKSFTIFEEYFDLITLLPTKEEQQELLYMIAEYMFYDKKPILNDRQMKIFRNLKRPLDISKQQSKRRTKKEPKKNQNETENKPQKNTSMMSMSMSVSNKSMSKFIKPSIEEIQEYCNERKNGIDANAFYDFYESKGWKVGNQSMKNWKACVRTWEQRNKKQENVPEWFNKEIKTTDGATSKELEELISQYE